MVCNGKRFIQPDPEFVPMVRTLFEWYSTGNYSLSELGDKAFAAGIVSKRKGKKLYKSMIHKILSNPIYYGAFLWSGKKYRGIHEPIVSKELFDKVQIIVNDKNQCPTRHSRYDWAFQGLVRCGHCGCALSAEFKKEKYIYYHCTGAKGKCPEGYVREDELARQLGLAIEAIRMDEEVIEWVVQALKSSHQDERRFHDEAVSKLQGQYQKLQNRLDGLYLDKLDRKVEPEFFEQKSDEWRVEQNEIIRKIETHQRANRSYVADGIRMLELSQKAASLYNAQNCFEMRKLLNFVVSNSTWKDKKLHPQYRQPFDMLAVANLAHQKRKAAGGGSNGFRPVWLEFVNSFKKFCLNPIVPDWRVFERELGVSDSN